jgi:hypothetical protein
VAEALVHEGRPFDAVHDLLYDRVTPVVGQEDETRPFTSPAESVDPQTGERVVVVDIPEDDDGLASVTDLAAWMAQANAMAGGVERG